MAIKNASFVLSDTELQSIDDGMDLNLRQITVANLTDNSGFQTFDVSRWTHGGTLTDTTFTDTVVATKDAGYPSSVKQGR